MPDPNDALSQINHLLKTPLTSIKAAGGLLAKRFSLRMEEKDLALLALMMRNCTLLEARLERLAESMVQHEGGVRLALSAQELAELRALRAEGGSPAGEPEEASGPPAPRQSVAKEVPLRHKTVLVADDTEDIRTVVAQALREEGYHVEEARDGHTAWQIITSLTPQLLILDGLMPIRDGFNLAREAKDYDPLRYRPKIILMTAVYKKLHYETEARQKFGVDVYLLKPFEMPVLLDHVRKLLGESA